MSSIWVGETSLGSSVFGSWQVMLKRVLREVMNVQCRSKAVRECTLD